MNNIQKTLENLNKKGFLAVYAENVDMAVKYILSNIKTSDVVGIGGSVTLIEIGIIEALKKRGNKLYSKAIALEKEIENAESAMLAGMNADVYLTSTNALTVSGDLVNIDGTGNRVAAMFYGPKKVIIITGKNKIVDNYNNAIERIKKIVCPINARKLRLNTPCAIYGECSECDSPQRMCNVTVYLQYPTRGKEIHIVLIDGDFGF